MDIGPSVNIIPLTNGTTYARRSSKQKGIDVFYAGTVDANYTTERTNVYAKNEMKMFGFFAVIAIQRYMSFRVT